MKNASTSTLTAIKILHTLIWLFFNVVFLYMVYAVIVNKIDRYVWIGMAFFLLEIIVLIIFKNICLWCEFFPTKLCGDA
jgi:hypothetical protein